jgi:DNA repair exonuclease SbcCD ATPase subunit
MTDAPTIGHNKPPPVVAMSLHVDDLFALVSGSTASPVTTDEQEEALDALLDDVRKAANDAEAQRKAEKKPHDDAAKAVQAAWKPLLDKCEVAAAALKNALTPYREARQRAKDEAARLAREEAEAKQKAAQEALKASDDLEERFAAEEQLKQASKLTAVANKIDRSATGLRTYWEAEITGRREALKHYITAYPGEFEALIQRLADADARGSRGTVPGITFHERKRAA